MYIQKGMGGAAAIICAAAPPGAGFKLEEAHVQELHVQEPLEQAHAQTDEGNDAGNQEQGFALDGGNHRADPAHGGGEDSGNLRENCGYRRRLSCGYHQKTRHK